MLLDILDENEVWIKDGNVVAQPEYFTTIWVTAAAFSVWNIIFIAFLGTVYPGIVLGIGTGALFSWGVRREARRINSDRRQPHKVVPEIVDWKKKDSLKFSHMNRWRLEYVGVTDSFQIIVGERKTITPVFHGLQEENEKSEEEKMRKRYGDVFTVPPLYVKRHLKRNKDYDRRMKNRKKKNVIGSKNRTYQEYLDTISQEKKKLNG